MRSSRKASSSWTVRSRFVTRSSARPSIAPPNRTSGAGFTARWRTLPIRSSIRTAAPVDQTALDHIAMLDGQRPLQGATLVGMIDGRPAAAVSLEDGRAIADPFRSTAHLVANLRVRAAGVTAYERTPSVRERLFGALSPSVRRAARGTA